MLQIEKILLQNRTVITKCDICYKMRWYKRKEKKCFLSIKIEVFFLLMVFFHRHWRIKGQKGKGGDHLSFHSATSTRSWTLRNLFATLHVRWLSHIFNRNACVYQIATWWDLPSYRITIWLIDWLIDWWWNICLFTR